MGQFRIAFEKREKLNPLMRVLVPVICVLLALLVCGILMRVLGYNPFPAYQKLFVGGFGSLRSLSESVLQAVPLMFCGLGVSVAFKMSLNNIGAEGQYMMGAFAATGVALYCPWIPTPLVLPAVFVAGFLGGGLWAMLAAAPRAFWGVNETIITLMFNYIALLLVDYFVYGPWRDTSAASTNLPYSQQLPPYARMAYIGSTRITYALFLALLAAVLIWIFFDKMVRGYQVRVIGASRRAASYAGMDIFKNTFIVMLISGGLAGLAGVAQVTGTVGCLQPDLAGGAGYTAIIISYLARFNPFVVLVVSVLFGGLTQGGYNIQVVGVPVQIVTTIQAMILFFVLGGEIFVRSRLVIRRKQAADFEGGEVAGK